MTYSDRLHGIGVVTVSTHNRGACDSSKSLDDAARTLDKVCWVVTLLLRGGALVQLLQVLLHLVPICVTVELITLQVVHPGLVVVLDVRQL